MKRRTVLAGLLAAALFPLLTVGCGGDDGSDGTTIRFAHFWSEPDDLKLLEVRIDEFEAANPGVTVETIELSWNDGKQKLFAMFDGNQVPDVIELGSDWVAQFAESGRLLAMTGADDIPASVPEGIAAPGQWEGTTYARPWVVAARGLFVNTDLLQEAGISVDGLTSWEDVLSAAEAINELPDAESRKIVGIGVNGDDRNRLFKKVLPLVWTLGGGLVDESGNPTLSRPENIRALEFYLTLSRNGLVNTQKELDQQFLAGRLGFWLSGPWLVDRIAQDNPELAFAIMPMPSLEGRSGVGIVGGEYLAISKDSEHLELARALVAFLTSPEQALAFAKDLKGGYAPADGAAGEDPYLSEGHQAAFTSQLETGRMTPVHPDWLEIQEAFERAIVLALRAEATPEEALGAAQEEILDRVASR